MAGGQSVRPSVHPVVQGKMELVTLHQVLGLPGAGDFCSPQGVELGSALPVCRRSPGESGTGNVLGHLTDLVTFCMVHSWRLWVSHQPTFSQKHKRHVSTLSLLLEKLPLFTGCRPWSIWVNLFAHDASSSSGQWIKEETRNSRKEYSLTPAVVREKNEKMSAFSAILQQRLREDSHQMNLGD